jgi:anti-sigma B factor antagonist
MAFKMIKKKQNGVLILFIAGHLDCITYDEVRKQLHDYIRSGESRIALDFDGVDYISSASLRSLLKSERELKARGGHMCLCSIREEIKEIIEITGFNLVFSIHPTLEKALQSLSVVDQGYRENRNEKESFWQSI